MLNHIVLLGRIGTDITMRYTQAGTPVVSFRMAVDRDFKDKATGERSTDWISVTAWRQTAEFIHTYFSKGRMAVVDGRLQIREWTDKEGNKRTTAEVVAESVYFGDSKREESGKHDDWTNNVPPPENQPRYAAPDEPMDQQEFSELVTDESKLPF